MNGRFLVNRRDAKILGVAAGLSDYTGIDLLADPPRLFAATADHRPDRDPLLRPHRPARRRPLGAARSHYTPARRVAYDSLSFQPGGTRWNATAKKFMSARKKRAGVQPHVVRYVLGVSLILVVILMSVIWIRRVSYPLTLDNWPKPYSVRFIVSSA